MIFDKEKEFFVVILKIINLINLFKFRTSYYLTINIIIKYASKQYWLN